MVEQFTNAASTTLNGGINNSVTALTVTSATGFPTTAPYRILVKAEGANTSELMLVTAGAGTTSWTVTRAVEAYAGSSSASAHGSGAVVRHVLTAGSLAAAVADAAGSVSLATVSIAPTDTYIAAQQATTNFGTATDLSLADQFNTSTYATFPLLKFDLSSLSAVQVANAYLRLKSTGTGNAGVFSASIYARKVYRNVDTATATWNIYSTGNSWSGVGASSPSDAEMSGPGVSWRSAVNQVTGEKLRIDLTDMVRDAIAAGETTLTVILGSDAATGSQNPLTFGSVNNATPGNRPALEVTYGSGNPAASVDPRALAQIGVRAYASGTQSISNTTITALLLDTEDYDTDGIHSTSSNTSRFTIPAGMGGRWHFDGGTSWASNGTGLRYLWWRKNGADFNGGGVQQNGAMSTAQGMTTSTELDLVPGDYVEMVGYQTSGGALSAGDSGGDPKFRTWVSTHKLDSGKVGAGIGAHVYRSTDQSLTTAVEATITFDSENFDTDGFHSTSGNTERLTIPFGLGGKYLVVGHGQFANATAGTFRLVRLYKNGATQIGEVNQAFHSNVGEGANAVAIVDLVAGDYITMAMYQDSGGALNAQTNGTFGLSLSVMRLDSGSSSITFGVHASKYNPDHETPTVTPAVAAEFNGSLDAGWSWSSAPTSVDYASQPGFAVLDHAAASGGLLVRSWAPGAVDLTVAIKMNYGYTPGSGSTHAYILGVGDEATTSGTDDFAGIYILSYASGGYDQFRIASITRASNAWTVGTEAIIGIGPMPRYYRMTRETATNTIRIYYSTDGFTWHPYAGTPVKAVTVSHLRLHVDAQAAMQGSIDWIRGWTSMVSKVGT